MTVRYVDGTGAGSDAYNGLAAVYDGVNGPKATTNGAEDTPVIAGDLVHVRPATYRELLTVDVSGTAGNPIEYRGDYAGAIWPSTAGQPVRITGAANETTTGTRANCITDGGVQRTYRTFRGIQFDGTSSTQINAATSPTNWIIDQCVFLGNGAGIAINIGGASQSTCSITNSVFAGRFVAGARALTFTHTVAVDNAAHTVKSCLFLALANIGAIGSVRVGGVTVSNSNFIGCTEAARVVTALTVGQVMTVNNCIITACATGLQATTTAEFAENYNTLQGNATDRSNVSTGANSVAYPPGFDMRPYFEAFGGGTLVLPLATLASYSGLVEYSAGTGAPSTDWRGHAVAGSLREWGVEEYVSGYGIEAGGGVTMWPLSSSFIGQILGAQ